MTAGRLVEDCFFPQSSEWPGCSTTMDADPGLLILSTPPPLPLPLLEPFSYHFLSVYLIFINSLNFTMSLPFGTA